MAIATLSTKGQVVIPAEIRRKLGLQPGDQIVFDMDDETRTVTLQRRETWDELSARFTSWIKPGTPPLLDASESFATREPRLWRQSF
jgi:AbrB family looped-hinge helix DNA binding protein